MNLKKAKLFRKCLRILMRPVPGGMTTRYLRHVVRGNLVVDPQCFRGLYLKMKGSAK